MPRPSKPKHVRGLPRCSQFFGEISQDPKCHILLSVEEFETVRLIDYLGMNQEECAASMNVSRITVQTLYADARKKLARFLVEGSNLKIQGGNFQLVKQDEKNQEKQEQWDEKKIRICVPYEEGRVFQHFGRSTEMKIYDIEGHKILSSQIVKTEGRGHGTLVEFVKSVQADVVICGGIGAAAKSALAEDSIQLFGGACGDADGQVASYLAGNLVYNPDYKCVQDKENSGRGCDHKKNI